MQLLVFVSVPCMRIRTPMLGFTNAESTVQHGVFFQNKCGTRGASRCSPHLSSVFFEFEGLKFSNFLKVWDLHPGSSAGIGFYLRLGCVYVAVMRL